MNCTGIIGAMEIEVENLKKQMTDVSVVRKAGIDFFVGRLSGKKAVVARSRVGKVNAAVCTQIMIDDFGVDAVINTGVAGSLNAMINIGDIVLSTDVVQHDVDAGCFGYRKGQIPQMAEFSFTADQNLRTLAEAACRTANPDIQVFQGRILSGDQFVSDRRVKEEIVREFGGFAVEMEGAAIGQTAYVNGVPFLIIRAISDKADGSAEMDYDAFEAEAARHSTRLTLELLRQLS
ncbi:MAG: 5'-methylthioadenosine/adenosylhomocysteine nucleosidase [Blautia sp.]|nr:5'-methylthioadenosine/adenosylhomocysteine nucleosidase [Blautia sp.]